MPTYDPPGVYPGTPPTPQARQKADSRLLSGHHRGSGDVVCATPNRQHSAQLAPPRPPASAPLRLCAARRSDLPACPDQRKSEELSWMLQSCC